MPYYIPSNVTGPAEQFCPPPFTPLVVAVSALAK